MNVGKTLFAQVMEFVPWKTFGRIIERHKGDAGVRTLGCADWLSSLGSVFSPSSLFPFLRPVAGSLFASTQRCSSSGLEPQPEVLL